MLPAFNADFRAMMYLPMLGPPDPLGFNDWQWSRTPDAFTEPQPANDQKEEPPCPQST
jgi:hypothetical protein